MSLELQKVAKCCHYSKYFWAHAALRALRNLFTSTEQQLLLSCSHSSAGLSVPTSVGLPSRAEVGAFCWSSANPSVRSSLGRELPFFAQDPGVLHSDLGTPGFSPGPALPQHLLTSCRAQGRTLPLAAPGLSGWAAWSKGLTGAAPIRRCGTMLSVPSLSQRSINKFP